MPKASTKTENEKLEAELKALEAKNKTLRADLKAKDKEMNALIKKHSSELKAKDKEMNALIKKHSSELKAKDKALSKKKKKDKDPNAPKKPKNGYMFFTDEKRNEVKAENKDAIPTEISKIIGKQWSALKVYKDDGKHQDKNGKFNYSKKAQKYLDKAADDKIRYQKEKAAYEAKSTDASSEEESKGVETPKKASKKAPKKKNGGRVSKTNAKKTKK